ncbi:MULTISPECIES: bacillithiol biosynthesis cysteine-adding enzyme BshC [unclassified Mucilaginibacter]|uniref:bacillithiol biosynthesis cysteine-adding enzyme BshC n=1 Tax=unclassified Mucilaginibacter TaxID=2617802 RepID=UPI0009663EAE|nr:MULTISPECIES: bacillithiol biosynthesis cysteine-adding enzyme BshC [unclassified Mucilaginibacter]OJW14334.1 MAG: bacillithiol biosynthesis cysteine-adding enzyme BshC [Mucilaginibacter sp. 44-25]PLW88592.1 MAG: bacillithiol biosynthesis cysteine-adding enzyme BshC [Mucilaginibacter sp.]HEK19410.1 bacillithiol biosynthesis cysteine-adding enzyme BshC [Bacteroidota bacterium]
MEAACIDYKDTGFFSQTVIDYLEDVPELRSFYGYRPTLQGFAEFFDNKKVVANRPLLAQVLTEQYFGKGVDFPQLQSQEFVKAQIELLKNDNTFTITTGHQLNIFTGPLYFIYKIVTAIKLCRQLKEAFPDKDFVPVYWMASEDHDFAEINYTNIGGKKVHWWYEAAGATGRINPDTMRQAINQYKGVLGIDGHSSELGEMVETAYTKFDKLADATRYLVNALFARYGLVIIDADDRRLKAEFAPIIERDIIEQNSFKNISEANSKLQQLGVHIQVNPREINFFYLKDQLRERIVFENGRYEVMNTDITFTEDELKQEIQAAPERFSPNVVMRPLYQECILPNAAYIGGGAEVVYWLELKSNFDFYGIDFPVLILRNSGLVVRKETAAKIKSMELSPAMLFKSTDEIKNDWVKKHSNHDLSLTEEWREFERTFEKIKLASHKIDPTLPPSAAAIQARLKHAVDNFQKKLVKAEKRNYQTRLEQIEHIKEDLFPKNSLQERNENFGLSYVKWGQLFIDELIRNFEPLDFKFTVLTE